MQEYLELYCMHELQVMDTFLREYEYQLIRLILRRQHRNNELTELSDFTLMKDYTIREMKKVIWSQPNTQ